MSNKMGKREGGKKTTQKHRALTNIKPNSEFHEAKGEITWAENLINKPHVVGMDVIRHAHIIAYKKQTWMERGRVGGVVAL